MTPPVALTVAGSDPGGGAGIQADLRTWAALGVHGTTVVTALTVQDTRAVHALHRVEPGVIRAQLDAVVADLPPAATKTGLLAARPVVELVAEAASAGRLGPLVVDPVLTASVGSELTPADLAGTYLSLLVPVAAVVTPNLPEAAWLTGRPVASLPEMEGAACRLLEVGAGAVVVTGGHLAASDGRVVDVLATADGVLRLDRPRVTTGNAHGTGCTYSAALTAHLARGAAVTEAAEAA
ncbi:MAG TPA: bifunctional hydroxymethylpyrimidine kinase/phosphomethylpyrimidine kinase, partial [Acidimicrobiales bacterium]|nr:bifunctional hydroxymethylpyrimidine kinase/phosphomethylpyrimidine kinase [Acidimicrobiales bacterium]